MKAKAGRVIDMVIRKRDFTVNLNGKIIEANKVEAIVVRNVFLLKGNFMAIYVFLKRYAVNIKVR